MYVGITITKSTPLTVAKQSAFLDWHGLLLDIFIIEIKRSQII